MKRIYNLKKQSPDHRDFWVSSLLNPHEQVSLPSKVDLRAKCPAVFDQGQLGSCTANAGIAAFMMLNNTPVVYSRLFQYYQERKIEHDINRDGGAQMRDIGKVLSVYGACLENYFPYDITKFTVAPTTEAISNAATHKVIAYHSIADQAGIKNVLALIGQPVLSGITVYSSFESASVAKTGIVPMPKSSESVLGGHAICIVGYDDTKKQFICRNSWGPGWGDKGYFYLPYDYFTKGDASDFWVLQK